jgi:hypothetical protein
VTFPAVPVACTCKGTGSPPMLQHEWAARFLAADSGTAWINSMQSALAVKMNIRTMFGAWCCSYSGLAFLPCNPCR